MADETTEIESLESWLSKKPYWEQFVWRINLDKESLNDEDIDLCYQYLSEQLGLIEATSEPKQAISFKNEMSVNSDAPVQHLKKKIVEIKNFANVNAISANCSIEVGPNLTLIYGGNGSGKSGVARLLCNACFSRGEREILPNVKVASTPDTQAKAAFLVDDGLGNIQEIDYTIGDSISDLKCFSVFDLKSVLIHLDKSNNVKFTPAQIKIFDKVADTISKLEEKLINEKNAKRKDNPFLSMFLSEDATSDTAVFCKGISANTKESDFLKHANFDFKEDEIKIEGLQRQIDEKIKLDIPKRKSQLAADRQNLGALKSSLEAVVDCLTEIKKDGANKIINDILEKKKLIEKLSVQSFDDGILKTIGSAEWKALIITARTLFEKEKLANENNEPNYCILCHQSLSGEAKTLFQKYWQFLESKAENELIQLVQRQSLLLQNLRSVKTLYPKFLETDAGIKVLAADNPDYLAQLKTQFITLLGILDNWINKINKLDIVDCSNIPVVDLEKITNIISTKTVEESKLVDPSIEIAKLTAQLNSLKHKKEVTAVKDAALEYIIFLKWQSKANGVNFSGIKMATTRKRTESFLVHVVSSYKGIFNQDLASLGCDFNLIMHASGDQGDTVKEYRLDFAEDYNPSQILSEGEQNACSLADFLTEVQLDKNNCGIIFDDPVTSLDHERKDKIAQRLSTEANQRQVVIFTHDMVFMSKLVKYATKYQVPFVAHWMKKIDGVPGCMENNTSPKLANLSSLKKDAQEAVQNFDSLGAKEQEIALGSAFDYLRSACEALIEETLFAGTIQRYDDQIKVQNLEEVVFNKDLAQKIVDLHGRISAFLLAHNRSDVQRENPPGLNDFKLFQKEFNELEASLKDALKITRQVKQQKNEAKKKVVW